MSTTLAQVFYRYALKHFYKRFDVVRVK